MKEARPDSPVSTGRQLRVLILEDTPLDAELMVAVLKRTGYVGNFEVIDSPGQFQEKLTQGDYDIIFADYNLRDWTALDALDILKKSAKDIPVVLVTGTLGDEAAVECIKQGATDYVLKHRLERLPLVVDRALRDQAHRVEAARLEAEIRRAKKEWELTFDVVPDPIFILNPECRIRRANRAAAKTFGLEFPQMIGRFCYEVVHGRSDPLLSCPHQRLLKTGKEEGGDLEEPRLGKTFHTTASPLQDPSGSLQGCVHVMRDVTERKRAENELRQSEERFRLIAENVADLIAVLDLEGKRLYNSPSYKELIGEPDAMRGTLSFNEIHPDDRERIKQVFQETVRTGCGQRAEFRFLLPNGGVRFIESQGSTIRDEAGKLIRVLVVSRDVTERKRAEEALVKLRKAVDNSGEVIFMTDREGVITFINPEFTRLYGYTEAEVVGKGTPRILKSGVMQPEDYAGFWETILGKRIARGEVINNTKDGQRVTVESSVNPILDEQGAIVGFLAIQRDVTERRKLETQLRQAQKMEAIGQLAGGIAHDFNNLLTIINGYSQLLLDRLDPADGCRGFADEVKRAGERAAALTRQLLAFSRRQVLAPQILDLNTVVTGVEKMLQRLIGEDIQLITALDVGLGQVRADPGQIELVILNLAVNSRDAMPQGGKLTLETANVELDSEYIETHPVATSGPHVMLAVSDTGCGMDRDTLSHIFEPFFTTKGSGKGTGLGLATVYGIVKQSGGNIWAYSEPGKGTTFKIYLPRVQEAVLAAAPAEGRTASPRGSETILVVEDDAAVRPLVRGVLLSRGYSVLEASRGDEALSVSESHRGPIKLLVTDIVMPGMNGRDLAEQLLLRHPETRILYMSGYTDDAMLHQGVLEEGAAFLQKPFTPDALARKVREVLDAPQSARQ